LCSNFFVFKFKEKAKFRQNSGQLKTKCHQSPKVKKSQKCAQQSLPILKHKRKCFHANQRKTFRNDEQKVPSSFTAFENRHMFRRFAPFPQKDNKISAGNYIGDSKAMTETY
jgi:hypothetical protein